MLSASQIRFAPVPKCASRSLKALGLLGEVDGRAHSRIVDYPAWDAYAWFVVDRDPADWYASWWTEAKRTPDAFTQAMGFRFESIEEDLALLHAPPHIHALPPRMGLHAWVPTDFTAAYAPYLSTGRPFKQFCFDTILSGVPCTRVPLPSLDGFLTALGLRPIYVNRRAA